MQDPAPFKSGRCPRRSGKSHAASGYAAHTGEAKPGSRVLIIGLTLKSAKENFWQNAPGGIQAFNARFNLGLDLNYTDVSWRHQNGSVGFIAGAETAADLERLRGSKVEADLIVVDECKSFPPDRLRELITDILLPGLMTRGGTLLLIGTPGSIPLGPFYEATCERSFVDGDLVDAKNPEGPREQIPTCIPYQKRDEKQYRKFRYEPGSSDVPRWSLHAWTLHDNVAMPGQWAAALRNQRLLKWDDNHPSWRREYLGEWVEDSSELVYSYALGRAGGAVNWTPGDRTAVNKLGLPEDGGPWHVLLGVDLGFQDDFALVVVAYGDHDGHLRHVWDWKCPHLDTDQAIAAIQEANRVYGPFESVVVDSGGLGAMIMATMMSRGIPAIAAEKTLKNDHIELLNADFNAGRVKVIHDSELHHELCGLQWDLSRGAKEKLARTGRLKESPACPNHLCDALLYVWRYAYHHLATARVEPVKPGTVEWWKAQEREMKLRAAERGREGRQHGRVDHQITRDRLAWLM